MSELDLSEGRAGRDPEWDGFVAGMTGGHHVQTTLWAEVKRAQGWRALRVVARRDGAITGGCQVLVRDLPLTGCIGYAPRGPLLGSPDPALVRALVGALRTLARRERILFLKVQPPPGGEAVVPLLEAGGFRPSALEAAPTATVRLDLTRPQDELLAGMHSRVRRNARKARRDGVEVRAGGDADIGTFFELVEATAARQGFPPYPREYYERIWRVFTEAGGARLLIAGHAGTALAAILVIGYADTAIYKMGGWSGRREGFRPNELLHLTGMEWAREAGYRWYDLDGIDPAVGQALAAGRVPPEPRTGVTPFKLGFGGEVALSPGALDGSFHPLLRWALRTPLARPRRGALAQRLLGRAG